MTDHEYETKPVLLSAAVEKGRPNQLDSQDLSATGLGPHFADIDKRFDAFDFVALDAGQYNAQWADIHMTPEEAPRAGELLDARTLLSGYAGRLALARHAWDEPFERAVAASKGKSYRLVTPRIGEPVHLADPQQLFTHWWKGIP